MSQWRADIFHSAIFRVSLINALLLMLALAGSYIGAWFATERSVDVTARNRIVIELEALTNELGVEGVVGVTDAIDWRSKRSGSLHYLLVADRLAPVGDMDEVPRTPGWHRFVAPGSAGESREMLANVVRTPDGTLIAVGEDLTASKEAQNLLFGAMLPVGAAGLTLGMVISVVATRRALLRMNKIVGVVRAVENGDLAVRVGQPGRIKDDIDALAIAIDDMLNRIDTLVATVGRVSAEIAHDLRTPLTHLQHALSTARWSADEVERGAALDAAGESLTRAIRLFDAMIRLAEIDSGRVQADFRPVEIGAVAERAIDLYRAEVEASGRRLAWLGAPCCKIRGDADLLTQAVANLVDNALKHTRPEAAITVRIDRARHDLVIAVEDDGPGVAPADVETMLRPFGRLDKARSTEGSGLGLAIANGIAKLHGGRLRVCNLDPGLSVAIELPCGPAAA